MKMTKKILKKYKKPLAKKSSNKYIVLYNIKYFIL